MLAYPAISIYVKKVLPCTTLFRLPQPRIEKLIDKNGYNHKSVILIVSLIVSLIVFQYLD